MRTFRLIMITLLALGLVPGLLTACSVTVGYSGTNIGNRIEGSYQKLNGDKTKEINADTGETIKISYSSVVETGRLAIVVKNSDGKTVTELETGTSGTETLTIGEDAPYKIIITGYDTKGSFDISWEKV